MAIAAISPERRAQLFNDTMTRLSRMGFSASTGITETHIVLLADEIERYREKISSFETHLEHVAAERDRLSEEAEQLRKLLDRQMQAGGVPVHHPAEYRVSELERAIVQQFLDQYSPKARP